MNLTDEQLLFGWDNEPGIVSVEPVFGSNLVKIYYYEGDELLSRNETYLPYIYTTADDPVLNDLHDGEVHRLAGQGVLNRMVVSTNPSTIWFIKNHSQTAYMPDPRSQYLISKGKTLYKGMDMPDVRHMSLDIETIASQSEYSNAQRPDDKIVMVQIHLWGRGGLSEHLIVLNEDGQSTYQPSDWQKGMFYNKLHPMNTEAELLIRIAEIIQWENPDVIIGHNLFDFDLTYIRDRSQMHRVPMNYGRDGSEPFIRKSKMKFADKEREYNNFQIHGRHVIDTELLARKADMVFRDMPPNFKLKDLIVYLDKARPDRQYIEGRQITDYWRNYRNALIEYGMEDARESRMLYERYGLTAFYSSQFIPMNHQDCFRKATESQIVNMYLRAYFKEGYAITKAEPKQEYSGAYTDTFVYGLTRQDVGYADFESLYPNVARIFGVRAGRDDLGVYPKINAALTKQRFVIKDEYRDHEAAGRTEQAAMKKGQDGSVKILLNTGAYGVLGSPSFPWNNYSGATTITTRGREMLTHAISLIKADGGLPLRCDTDGIILIPPQKYNTKQGFIEYCQSLTERSAKGLTMGFDGWFKGVITINKKSYALLKEDGKIKITGSTLKGRSMEPFAMKMTREFIETLFTKGKMACADVYWKYRELIEHGQLSSDDIAEIGNIKMSLEAYRQRLAANENGKNRYNPMAQYEVALATGRTYMIGDSLMYFVAKPDMIQTLNGHGKTVTKAKQTKKYEKARPISEFSPDKIDRDHYLGRLEEATKKWLPVFEPNEYQLYFNITLKAADLRKRSELTITQTNQQHGKLDS